MPWLAIIEMLLPMLLKLLEDCPEDRAVALLKRRGWFVRMRINQGLQDCLPELCDAALDRLASMNDDDFRELVQAAASAKEARNLPQ